MCIRDSARPGDRPNHGVTQFVMADCRATPAFDEIVVGATVRELVDGGWLAG